MESHIIDGNNILEVYTQWFLTWLNDIRKNPRPSSYWNLKPFRMRGHEEASGTKVCSSRVNGNLVD